MIKAICKLKSVSPYSQGKIMESPKLRQEKPADYEERCWREKMHTTKEGYVYIPCTQFSNSIKEAAKYLGEQIQGKGKATYTKHFMAGVLVVEHLVLPIKASEVPYERLFVASDGKTGGKSPRVWRYFPLIESWEGVVTYIIVDHTITEDVFRRHLMASGSFIGIGRFRPINGGYYGRFVCDEIKWIVEE